ncbi:hypothetical protein MLD38_038347 [Melastoma candidum]|uniref:Uncharacterized protein n=1 Tax=Melastoma candidum TaxID=119954 RepID=A0ACB9KZV0_9MYRT|nr:hypothetical protein MLD38_038347 [Melastoma candidum]
MLSGAAAMRLLRRSLVVLVAIVLGFRPGSVAAVQNVVSDVESGRALDVLLQDYAYRAFIHPKTGVPYDGAVPGNLTGVEISVLRLRSGSLRTWGVAMYKEFEIPTGIIVRPYVVRLGLVYQNLGNWSSVYYPLPGYRYLAPILGLLAYNASNLSATNSPELDITASGSPIIINFTRFIPVLPSGTSPKCVRIDLNGSVDLSSTVSNNMCSTTRQGHFSVAIESPSPSPGMAVLPPPPPAGGSKRSSQRAARIAGSVLGSSAVLAILALSVSWARKHGQGKDIRRMERAAEAGEALRVAPVGETRAPSATATRTQPLLEHEYVT